MFFTWNQRGYFQIKKYKIYLRKYVMWFENVMQIKHVLPLCYPDRHLCEDINAIFLCFHNFPWAELPLPPSHLMKSQIQLKVSRLLSWTARTNCPLPPSSRFLLSPSTRIFGSRSGTFHGDLLGPQISGRRAPERHRSQRVKTGPALLSSSLLARLGLLGGCLSSPAEPNRRVFTSLLLLAGEACRCAGQRFVSHTVKHNSS